MHEYISRRYLPATSFKKYMYASITATFTNISERRRNIIIYKRFNTLFF